MFSRTVPPNSVASWATSPICAAQARHGDVADVDAVDPDRARRHVPQARDEPDQRRLARARRPDQGEGLPRRDRQRDVAQRPGGRAGTRTTRRRARSRPATGPSGRASGASRIVGRVSMISNTRSMAPVPSRNWPYRPAMRAEARPDGHAVQQEPGQRPDPERAIDDLVAGVPEQRGDGPEAEEPHQRPERRPPQRQARAGRDDACAGPSS